MRVAAFAVVLLLGCGDDRPWHWRPCPSRGAVRYLLAVRVEDGRPVARTEDHECEQGDDGEHSPARRFDGVCRWQWVWLDPRAVKTECRSFSCVGSGDARLAYCGISWRTGSP